MTGVEYCSIQSTWKLEGNGRFSDCISYNLSDENYVSNLIEQWSDQPVISLLPPTDETTPCTLNVKILCNAQTLTGFHIITSARRVEVSSNAQGYLCTQTGESCGNGLYSTRWSSRSHFQHLQLKFVSLTDKTRFDIHGMQLDVKVDPASMMPASMSTVQMDKVNEMMRDMGLEGSQSADGLRKALELAETVHRQVQCNNMTAGLAAMTTECSGTQAAGGNSASGLQMAGMLNSVMSVLGIPQVTSGEEQLMYLKLQDLCTRLGQQKLQQDQPVEGATHQSVCDQLSSLPADVGETSSTKAVEELQTSTAKELSAMEKRIMSAVDEKVDKLEQKLSKKLDMLLEAVCKSQHYMGLD